MVGGSQHEQALGECWGLLHTRQRPWRTEGDAGGARPGLVPRPSCGNLYVSCEGAELRREWQCSGAEETRRPARALLWPRQSKEAA